MHGLFAWTVRPFCGRIWSFCPAKESMHALQSHFGHRLLLVLLPANYDGRDKIFKKAFETGKVNRKENRLRSVLNPFENDS